MKQLLPSWVSVPRLDFGLLIALLFLLTAGLVVLYSASNQDMGMVYRQSARFGLGLVAMIVISQKVSRWAR